MTKPLFPLANGVPLVLGARFADRVGKGLRGAPRDALVADATPGAILGRAFGLRQALDTAGAFLGPLLATGLMLLLAGDIRAVLWIAVIPAVIAVLLVVVAVKDPGHAEEDRRAAAKISVREIGRLDRAFWNIVMIGVVFTLARFSEAFLILKAAAAGLPPALAPLVLVVMSLFYALGAYPAGALSDRTDARRLLGLGLGLLIVADLVLALSSRIPGIFIGIALWGSHMAVTQGLLSKLVAETAPSRLRASAFGVFSLATGGALLVASVVAGLLWEFIGPAATFVAGAGFALVAGAMTLAGAAPRA